MGQQKDSARDLAVMRVMRIATGRRGATFTESVEREAVQMDVLIYCSQSAVIGSRLSHLLTLTMIADFHGAVRVLKLQQPQTTFHVQVRGGPPV
jgi:hypothetical protein